MGWLRAFTAVVLALGAPCATAAFAAAAPAPLGRLAAAHPEPNDLDVRQC